MKERRRDKEFQESPLNSLVITWDNNETPVSAEVKSISNKKKEQVKFQGNPRFNQNIINKKYIPARETWYFIDDEGIEYTFNTATLQTTQRSIKGLRLDE